MLTEEQIKRKREKTRQWLTAHPDYAREYRAKNQKRLKEFMQSWQQAYHEQIDVKENESQEGGQITR